MRQSTEANTCGNVSFFYTANLRIVLLTGPGRQHRYLANRLSRELPLVAIVIDNGLRVSNANKLKRLLKRYSLFQIVGRVSLFMLRSACFDADRKEKRLADVFGDECE